MKKAFPIVLVIFLVSGFTGALVYVSAKNKYLKATEMLNNSQKLAESKFKKVASMYLQKNDYLMTIAKTRNQDAHLKTEIDALNAQLSKVPYDIEAIEILSSKLNQKVAADIVSFNAKKKSVIFTNVGQIRSLEQYDRRIDLARTEFSDWTYDYMAKKTSLERAGLFKANVKDIGFFKVDHLIRSASK